MIVIGELINTSRKEIDEAVNNKDEEFFINIAKKQEEAGASYIDVNAGSRIHDEVEMLTWLVELVQEHVNVPLCIDSPNPVAADAALELCKKRPLFNSISAEKARFEEMIPIVSKHDCQVVALCMDDSGMPADAEARIKAADYLAENLLKNNFKEEDIFFDPVISPMSVSDTAAEGVFGALKIISEKYPKMHITSGLSNISYGLPNRSDINHAFLLMCRALGMDSAIIDPLNDQMQSGVVLSEMLLGNDRFCTGYLKFQRGKK